MIKIKAASKSFGETKAVNSLTIDIPAGITGLIGHNGAGKSTLLRLISGVYILDEGSIYIDENEATTQEAKKNVFFLPDDPYIPAHYSMKDVYDFYSTFYDVDSERYWGLIDKFALPKNQKVTNFSKGMKRQLYIAISLAIKVKYLLIDEGFDGLDPLVLNDIKEEILKENKDDKTIIIASHNINTLDQLADRFVILYQGKLGQQGESIDMGQGLVKYQVIFKTEVTQSDLEALGLEVIVMKKIGSVTNFVVKEKEDIEALIKEKYETLIFEQITIEPDEAVVLEMMMIKNKEGK
ncbi:MAG: ATP-binding cassette domain-containing protein [Bacilli bacterium]|nr:ATP-binding cassette domain-containing protein [Bacilli bacterium]